MRQQYKVLDTNILIANPKEALYGFKPRKKDTTNHLIIPMQVLTELDRIGGEKGTERGRSAKKALSLLKEIKTEHQQSLFSGIEIENNYIIQSSTQYDQEIKNDVYNIIGDNHDLSILQVTQNLKDMGKNVELVTNDSGAFDIADAIGLEVNTWGALEVVKDLQEAYKGWRKTYIDFDLLTEKRFLAEEANLTGLMQNEFVIPENRPNEPLIFKDGMLEPLYAFNNRKSKVKAMNSLQKCYMHALRDPDINIVFAIGKAGTAKTYLATDAGIEQCFYNLSENFHEENFGRVQDEEYSEFNDFLVTRPLVAEKENYFDIGALPGDLEEKLAPWIQPINDQLEQLWDQYGISDDEIEHLKEKKRLDILATLHMRGRSLPNQYWVIDEAQNTTPFQLKTALTRIGNGSKVIVTGDPEQCDIKGMDALKSNTLIYGNEQFKNYKRSATIFFDHEDYCVRSELAREAIKRL